MKKKQKMMSSVRSKDNNKIFKSANILIPKDVDLYRWSVVACDQHTSDLMYWNYVKEITKGFNSSYDIIVPEAYLRLDKQKLIKKANDNMKKFINNKIFTKFEDSLIYVERTLSNGKIRQGVVGEIDLEQYSENASDNVLIKPSEEIVEERIIPRVEIRKNAVLDMPHAILFCVDREKFLIEPLKNFTKQIDKVYDFELMLHGGHIKGYKLNEALKRQTMLNINKNIKQYGMIVADGNHSLLAAKKVYEQYKVKNQNYLESPLRFALVEIVNLFNNAVQIEPIYRVVKNVNSSKILTEFEKNFSCDALKGSKTVEIISKNYNKKYCIAIQGDLEIKEVQKFLDEYIKINGGEIDYIHDLANLEELCNNEGVVGFKLEPITKDLIVEYTKNNLFPRKTFSIGLSSDKRYYLECRKL